MDEKVERKIKDFKVPKGKQLVARVILEFTAITGVGIFLLGQYVLDKSRLPYQRGFYCDDENAQINPDAQEICDDIDNDCDGAIDDEDPTGFQPRHKQRRQVGDEMLGL